MGVGSLFPAGGSNYPETRRDTGARPFRPWNAVARAPRQRPRPSSVGEGMAQNGVARLKVYGGPGDGTTILLTGSRVTSGRLKANDVVLRDIGVSRFHAVLEKTEAGFVLRDLDSTNGRFVNHEHIGLTPHVLSDGDAVSVAPRPVSFVFEYVSRAESKGSGTGRTVPTAIG